MQSKDITKFMELAIEEAKIAEKEGDLPVACIIVKNSEILALESNRVERDKNPTHHAEILAISKASNILNSKYLDDCICFVTLEPCAMCAKALILSKISKLYFGAYDIKTGACGSVFNITQNTRLNHKIETYGGILEETSAKLLKDFFQKKRK
jgi:tRNA(adenine34) deaminase